MVQERVSPLAKAQGMWKLPGGLADPGVVGPPLALQPRPAHQAGDEPTRRRLRHPVGRAAVAPDGDLAPPRRGYGVHPAYLDT